MNGLREGNQQLHKRACLWLEKCEEEVLENCYENLMQRFMDDQVESTISKDVCYDKLKGMPLPSPKTVWLGQSDFKFL